MGKPFSYTRKKKQSGLENVYDVKASLFDCSDYRFLKWRTSTQVDMLDKKL